MKVLIVFTTLAAYAAGQGFFGGFAPTLPPVANIPGANIIKNIPGVSNVQNFAEFAAQTGKQYATEAERVARQGIFEARKKVVDDHNELFKAGNSAFELGVNYFSDLKLDEIIKGLTGRKRTSKGDTQAAKHKVKSAPPANVAIPDSFDWVEQGGVTPVKFQGLECGACWSFAVTGAIEGHYFRKTKNLINLSEQNLVDCSSDYDNTGCDGGFQEYGFAYVADNKGIDKGESYPYTESNGKCTYKPSEKGAEIQGFDVIPPGDEAKMKEVIATKGPLACSVNAAPDSFVLYKQGIYDDAECNSEEVNHAILVVGYGTENGKDYWKVKNSWTEKWGEGGYIKIPRNQNSFCGIASECSYPIV